MKHMCVRAGAGPFVCMRTDSLLLARARRSYLSKEMQDKQTPFAFYVQKELAQVQAERAERAALGTGQPYNRQLP